MNPETSIVKPLIIKKTKPMTVDENDTLLLTTEEFLLKYIKIKMIM
jgi:hypothetical protein